MTKVVTSDVEVTLRSTTRLEGRANTTITRSADNLQTPHLATVTYFSDEIRLGIAFVTVALE